MMLYRFRVADIFQTALYDKLNALSVWFRSLQDADQSLGDESNKSTFKKREKFSPPLILPLASSSSRWLQLIHKACFGDKGPKLRRYWLAAQLSRNRRNKGKTITDDIYW
ncbi:hypothetical protein chiPu_0003373 [Chiloscyllium punctatum]|uniref:Uncharacterized protein n=1 Tax=Chiloscyllium punctatum TaxID=137246 RepID=A0A401S3K1_CHIPU|nr:hypothetical protein [Chiloscyllium punctatum]